MSTKLDNYIQIVVSLKTETSYLSTMTAFGTISNILATICAKELSSLNLANKKNLVT